jgi:hypothetical protein
MKKRILFSISLIFSSACLLFSGEGMWIPLLLDSLNYEEMKEKGLRLSAEEIYSINGSSLKDAVVLFGGGCTGEIISPEGLLITNHHCGYSRITAHSTVENNYLADGFWAGSKTEELPNPGLTVTFLVRMENVTDQIMRGVDEAINEEERNLRTKANMLSVTSEAIQNTHFQAEIKPFYFGKEYYLFVYEIFRDVRLVGTPPEAIGNFGGDTDNWIWPRHTGDFSLFRIYAGKDNKPADYSPDNIPYKPKKYLNISVKGLSEGDFTMVMGYPANTDQFLTSDALAIISEKSLPAKIQMRTARLTTMQGIMNRGVEEKLHYASKYRSISNAWKKWIGVTRGIERANILEAKRKQEQEFLDWALQQEGQDLYKNLPGEFSSLYKAYAPLYLTNDLATEFLNSIESSGLINQMQIKFFTSADSSKEYRKQLRDVLYTLGRNFFKTSATEIDRMVLPVLLKTYAGYVPLQWHPAFYKTIKESFNGDYEAYVSHLFDNSIFTDSVKFHRAIKLKEQKLRDRIINDPFIALYRDFSFMVFNGEIEKLSTLETELKGLYRKYVSGLMEMDPSKKFYPDANFTMRLTYGEAKGYTPADAVDYDYYTTIDGVIEKENEQIEDYHVPEKLKDLYAMGDFGLYTKNGRVPVCFIASNHTSGGNSGSPVMDADGNLVGINFDRNWEGTLSDYAYDPKVCRNISLDIRYVLFIIDQFADADWLLNELTIIKN